MCDYVLTCQTGKFRPPKRLFLRLKISSYPSWYWEWDNNIRSCAKWYFSICYSRPTRLIFLLFINNHSCPFPRESVGENNRIALAVFHSLTLAISLAAVQLVVNIFPQLRAILLLFISAVFLSVSPV